jgi:adenine-specific DNA methylase
LRFSEVERNFGNKTTWDTPFETHFRKFVAEANQAILYISKKGVGVDYFGFYHFLEGLVRYPEWGGMIDYRTKHRKLKGDKNPWVDKNQIFAAFERLIKKFADSTLVISYRSDGIPSIAELIKLLKKYKPDVVELKRKNYKYVLSNNHSEEVLLIAR